MEFTLLQVVAIASPLVAGAAAWGGTVKALNGTRERVRNVEANSAAHERLDQGRHLEVVERLTRIETKLEERL